MNTSKKNRNRSKYTYELSQVVTQAVEEGSSLENASKLAGISRPTIYAWKKKYKGFAKRLEEALAKQEIKLVSCIYNSDDWRAQAFLLERRFPDRWSKNRKVEVNRSDVESKLSELKELAFLGIIQNGKEDDELNQGDYG